VPQIIDIIPGYLHKSHLTLLTGPPYVGKSRFLSWICSLLTTGQEGFWPRIPPLKVLFCTERTLEVVGTQFQGLGLSMDNPNLQFITIADKSPEWYRTFERNPLAEIGKTVKLFQPNIVVFDTLIHFLAGEHSVNNYGSMAKQIMSVQLFASQQKVAVLAVHHTAKQKIDSYYGSVNEKTLGSQAIIGNTTAIWNLSKTVEPTEGDSVYLTLHAETHTTLNPKDIFLKVDKNQPFQIIQKSEYGGLQELILSIVANDSFIVKDLVELVVQKTHSAPKNVYKALSKLADKGKISLLGGLVSKTIQN
jgi:RecA-family ATPase